MQLHVYPSASSFHQRAEPYLLEREALNNLPLGLCRQLIDAPLLWPGTPYLALAEAEGQVVAAAVRTPPHLLILCHATRLEAVDLFARDLLGSAPDLSGVTGPSQVSLAFAEAWRRRTGRTFRREMPQRIYQLENVRPPAPAPGQMRQAGRADAARLVDWLVEFGLEAMGESDPADIARRLEATWATNTRGYVLWEVDGRPVAMAGYSGPTPNGIRIMGVYTPPGNRRQGYASALVASLSQHLLDQGRRYCFLYTDLGNPTSNHIYQAIGYQPVGDADVYHFT